MARARSQKKMNGGRAQVMRERFQLEKAEQYAPITDQSLEDLIPSLLKSMGMEQDYWVQGIEDRWPEVVGKEVALHTRPGRFERKQLTVFVKHSIWLMELERNGKKQMLLNLQEAFGAEHIRTLRLQLDPDQ